MLAVWIVGLTLGPDVTVTVSPGLSRVPAENVDAPAQTMPRYPIRRGLFKEG